MPPPSGRLVAIGPTEQRRRFGSGGRIDGVEAYAMLTLEFGSRYGASPACPSVCRAARDATGWKQPPSTPRRCVGRGRRQEKARQCWASSWTRSADSDNKGEQRFRFSSLRTLLTGTPLLRLPNCETHSILRFARLEQTGGSFYQVLVVLHGPFLSSGGGRQLEDPSCCVLALEPHSDLAVCFRV